MAYDHPLSAADQTRLGGWIRPAIEAVNKQRLLAIFKRETALVGDSSTRGLKRIVGDSSELARLLVEGLQHRSTQHRACVALQSVIQAAWKTHTLNDRVRQRFLESSAAMKAGNWEKVQRLSQRLEEFREDEATNHPLLVEHQRLLMLESGSPERVFAALEWTESSSAPQEGTPTGPHTQAAKPTPPPEDDVDAFHRQDLTARSLGPLGPSPGPRAGADRAPNTRGAPDSIVELIVHELATLRALRDEARAPDPVIEDVWGYLARVEDAAALNLDPDAPATQAVEALRELIRLCATALEEVEEVLNAHDEETSRASQRLVERLGGDSLDKLEQDFESRRPMLAVLPDEVLDLLRDGLEDGAPLAEVFVRIDEEHEEWQAARAAEKEKADAVEAVARAFGISIEEAAERLTGQARLPFPDPAVRPVSPPPGPTPVHGLAFPDGHPYRSNFTWSGLLSIHKGGTPAAFLLPLNPNAGLAGAGESSARQATATGATVLRLAESYGARGRVAPSAILDLLADATELAGDAETPAGSALVLATLAFLLLSASSLRQGGAGPRLVRRLSSCEDLAGVREVTIEVLRRVAGDQGTPTVLAAALKRGQAPLLAELARAVQAHSVVKARLFGEALAVAAASLDDDEPIREAFCTLEGLGVDAIDGLETWLAGFAVRKRRPQPPLPLDLPPWLAGYCSQRALCLYETEARGRPTLNASVPRQVEQHGVYVEEGQDSLVLPVMIRNAGKGAAAGLELSIDRATGVEIEDQHRIHHVSWLACTELEAPNDAILEVRCRLLDQNAGRVSLVCEWRHSTGELSPQRTLVYTLTRERPAAAHTQIPGVNGSPMDLLDAQVLERSSRTVQEVYIDLRDRLRRGEPVKRMVYGRRRRGKSSIRSSLKRDQEIRQHFLIGSSEWNAARMTRVEAALIELTATLGRALAKRNIDVPPFAPEGLSDRDGLYRAWKHWLGRVAEGLPGPTQVLLLIDEFQKWLAALEDQADRQTVLNAFRDFNDDAIDRKLSVAFVLFGLRSLKHLSRATNDFGNAVKAEEIRALNLENAARYVREILPVASDGRARRRLARLSGGNPFVLNLLTAELNARVGKAQRPYALETDVDALVEDMSSLDSRIDSFFGYMLKTDEDESAPELPQLTVLRVVAVLLNAAGDSDRFVSVEDVEEWLEKHEVPFEDGLPAEHLSQLANAGVLERHGDKRRFGLRGEAMCRWLANRRAAMQPVARLPDADMVLNRYRVVKELDRGGQNARVYLADDTSLEGRKVALKIYPGSDVNLRTRVEREARLLSRAQGRYVVPFHHHGFDERKGGVLVMQWIDGRTLASMLQDPVASARPMLPGGEPRRHVELMKKLAEGVTSLHSAGVVHKDLSSRNVMLVEEAAVWEPRLIDFGISGELIVDGDDALDETTDLGTARYMAPEKVKLQRSRSRAADVYSLGVLFLDIAAAREGGQTPDEQLLAAELPSGLAALIRHMLSEDPEQRPTAEVVRARLDGVLDPVAWTELAERGLEAYVEGELVEALAFYRRAMADAPSEAYGSAKLSAVLGDAWDCISSAPEHMDWWDTMFGAALEHAREASEPMPWTGLLEALASAQRGTSAGARVYAPLVHRLEVAPHPSATDLVLGLSTLEGLADKDDYADRFFYLLASYHSADLMPAREAAAFCARRATSIRTFGRPLTEVELWLRRGRRLDPTGNDALARETKAYEAVREQTGTLQHLPLSAEACELALGDNEGGHDNQDRIAAFARKLHSGHPYVAKLKRLRKKGQVTVSVPTLQSLTSADAVDLRGLPAERVITLLLDPSYTRSTSQRDAASLRMAIVLPEGTTSSQRQAAYDRLREDHSLFPQ